MKTIIKEDFIGLYDENDELHGNLDFILVDDILETPHTHVNPVYRGYGYADLLFDKLIEFAQENNYKINPICPFVKSKLYSDDKYAKYRI